MNGKTHLFAGVVVGTAVAITKEQSLPLFVLGSGLGSLLPDIDHPNSILGRLLPFHLFLTHRGFTHSLLFVLIAGTMALAIGASGAFIYGLCIGILSHLALDIITPMGLPSLMFPLSKNKRL